MSVERILLITSEEVSLRVTMPPIGTLSLGSAPSNTVALEALDPEQLIFFAEEELAVEVLASPVEIADAGSTKFRPAPTGQLIEVRAGAKVRCGSLEIELIALTARYHRKSAPKPEHPEFAALRDVDQDVVRKLAAILRVALAFDRAHAGAVAGVTVDVRPKKLVLTVHPARAGDPTLDLELYTANERKDLLETVLDRPVEIEPLAAVP